jgi:hypothetical protein
MVLAGCSSGPTTLVRTPPANYQQLGRATGSACGSMLVLSTAYYFIPIAFNSRVKRAYQSAIASVPGATGLVDVTIQENWYWWLLGTARCVTITGEAIK